MLRITVLFLLAAVAEIGGAWLIWQAVKEDRGWLFAVLGVMALGAYGFIAALQPDANFGRVLGCHRRRIPADLVGRHRLRGRAGRSGHHHLRADRDGVGIGDRRVTVGSCRAGE